MLDLNMNDNFIPRGRWRTSPNKFSKAFSILQQVNAENVQVYRSVSTSRRYIGWHTKPSEDNRICCTPFIDHLLLKPLWQSSIMQTILIQNLWLAGTVPSPADNLLISFSTTRLKSLPVIVVWRLRSIYHHIRLYGDTCSDVFQS